jgi:imidazolonepropionase-like amidohydrolase
MSHAILADAVLGGEELQPIAPGAIVVNGDRIVSVGPPAEVATDADETLALPGATLLPGFIDAHVHIGFADPLEVLRGGVTTARDLGWPPRDIWPLVDASRDPDWPGPLLLAAGQMLTVPGGYPMAARWAPPATGRPIMSLDDAASAVGEQAAAGATIVKVSLNAAVGPTLGLEELEAIVHAANAHGLRITGHVTGLAELDKALDAGIHELAHMLMSEEVIPPETIERMTEQEMVVVPTLACRFGTDREVAIANLRAFLNAGGRVVYGTDLGNEGPRPGIDAREIDGLISAGMTGTEIVASATVHAARWLGMDEVGILAAGMQADMVAVAGDPLVDANALVDLVGVWRAGRRVR